MGGSTNSTWVRLCPLWWTLGPEDALTAGFVVYHELVHMVSTVGDGYGGYSKSAGVELAVEEPAKARL